MCTVSSIVLLLFLKGHDTEFESFTISLEIHYTKYWIGFVGIVIRWLIWLVGEEMKFGIEFCRDELSLELGPNKGQNKNWINNSS